MKKVSPYPPAGVNLTGLPRRVKDSCADVYNSACTRWEKTKLQGARIIRRIAALKYDDTPDETRLCELCDDLVKTMDDLSKHVDTISSVRKNFEALVKIHQRKAVTMTVTAAAVGDDHQDSSDNVPFLSYTLDKYLEMIRTVEQSYVRELELKRSLIKRVPLQNRQALFVFVTVCWLHDPLIDENVMRTVLALVAECGFK